jgi:hypothetical protein
MLGKNLESIESAILLRELERHERKQAFAIGMLYDYCFLISLDTLHYLALSLK